MIFCHSLLYVQDSVTIGISVMHFSLSSITLHVFQDTTFLLTPLLLLKPEFYPAPQSATFIYSLIPRPPQFLSSVCVHNTMPLFLSVYYCEHKWKNIKQGRSGNDHLNLNHCTAVQLPCGVDYQHVGGRHHDRVSSRCQQFTSQVGSWIMYTTVPASLASACTINEPHLPWNRQS